MSEDRQSILVNASNRSQGVRKNIKSNFAVTKSDIKKEIYKQSSIMNEITRPGPEPVLLWGVYDSVNCNSSEESSLWNGSLKNQWYCGKVSQDRLPLSSCWECKVLPNSLSTESQQAPDLPAMSLGLCCKDICLLCECACS